MSTHRRLAKSAGIIGALTGVSRVLGFVRDMVIAAAFGTGVGAEAFVVSFKLPNLLRDLVGERATNSAFVPVLTECREKKQEEFWPLVSTLFYILSVALVFLTVLGVVFAPQIVKLLAPGFVYSQDPEKFPLTVRLTRAMFPYIFLIGLSALAMGVLNALKEFTSSALGPALLNVSLIVAGVCYEKTYGPMALVFGVLVGGVLQLGCQVPALLKSGFRLTLPRFDLAAVRKTGKLLIPRALGSAIYQINVFVDSILASFEKIVGIGGQSALYYSNRLFQLPLAIFGIALAQAVLPTFSTQIVRRDIQGFKETISMALRSLILLAVPASVGLIVLARPIIRIIFQHGRFNAYSTAITSNALFFYAFGLLSCSFIKIFVNAFYATQDTRTPVKTMAFSVVVNVALSLCFMKPLGVGGLALASSLSATLNTVLLYRALKAKIGPLGEKEIAVCFVKALFCSLAMAATVLFYDRWVLEPHMVAGRTVQMILLFAGIGAGVAVYLVCGWLVRVRELRKLLGQ